MCFVLLIVWEKLLAVETDEIPRDLEHLTNPKPNKIDMGLCCSQETLESIRKSQGQIFVMAGTISKDDEGGIERTIDANDYGVFIYVCCYQLGGWFVEDEAGDGDDEKDDEDEEDGDEEDGNKEDKKDDKKGDETGGKDKPRIYVFMHLAYRGEKRLSLEYLEEGILQKFCFCLYFISLH